jgi:hypothetical protein
MRFVDQSGALKSVCRTFGFEMVMGKASQLVINQRE